MRRPGFIARQSAHPRGLLGRLVARVMRSETSEENDRALETLSPSPSERLVEIGFGPGRTIARLATRVPDGRVCGIDHSELMLQVARERNRTAIEAGRVELRAGDSSAVPWPAGSFDGALAVHVVYFWNPLAAHLAECRRVLSSGGRLVLAYRAARDHDAVRRFPDHVYRFPRTTDLRSGLHRAGFGRVSFEEHRVGDRLLEIAVARGGAGQGAAQR